MSKRRIGAGAATSGPPSTRGRGAGRKGRGGSSSRGRGGGGGGGRGRGGGGGGGRGGGVRFNLEGRGGGDDYINAEADSDVEEDDDGIEGKKRGRPEEGEEEEEGQHETVAEKRLRMAKHYLAQMEAAVGSEDEGSEEDDEEEGGGGGGGGKIDVLGARLERERLKASGLLRRALAESLRDLTLEDEDRSFIKGHKLSPTCVVVSADGSTAFTGSKDNAILQYDLETNTRTATLAPFWRGGQGYQAHEKEVLAMAVSSDGRYLAAGGRDQEIRIWDLRKKGGSKSSSSSGGNAPIATVAAAPVKTFTGHRDAVSALAFRTDSHALYSGSFDRCLKHWNLDGMTYVETLFGHQAEINCMDAWRKERPVTCGRDRTVRVWKLVDESHMLLKCPQGASEAAGGLVMGGSLDCLAMLSEESYVTGGEDGMLALWNVNKKKPVAVIPAAHGGAKNWIASVATVKGSDLVASGSNDGHIRLWQASSTAQGHGSTLKAIKGVTLPCAGYVNGLAFGKSGAILVAACGKEHRLGRWAPMKEARNGVVVMRLPLEEEEEWKREEEEEEESEEEEEESGSGSGEESESGSGSGEEGEEDEEEEESDEEEE